MLIPHIKGDRVASKAPGDTRRCIHISICYDDACSASRKQSSACCTNTASATGNHDNFLVKFHERSLIQLLSKGKKSAAKNLVQHVCREFFKAGLVRFAIWISSEECLWVLDDFSHSIE
jgi:hypothetical protein